MKHRYRVGFIVTIPANSTQEDAERVVAVAMKRQTIRYLKKSSRTMNWKMKAGYNGDDFVKNMYSISCHADLFLIPRIVKNYLLKKLK